jgi:type I restriction enzyme S subunit
MAEKVEFYKETEFKDTEIGKIPKEWEVVKLENVVEIEDKYRIPVKKQDRQLGPFPYCGANGIIDYVAGYTHDGKFVLLAEDGGFFGPFENSAYIMRGKFWANNHVHILKAIEEVLISEFLAFCLNFINLVPFLTGSTRPKLIQEDMGMIPLPLPPLPEQQKIAEILSSVDESIQKTDEVIAKTERLKKGLMQELVTRGIGHKEFKDTEIGRIPKEWEVMVAADVADYINGYPFSPTDWKMHGIPIIRIQNLNDPNAEFNYFDGKIDDIYKIKNGDLLFSWSASIGIHIWKGGDAVLNQHIFKVVPKANINKLFLYYDLLLAIEQLKSRVHGSTMKHFQKNELKTTFIPIPPPEEQQKIAEIISAVDEKLEILKQEKVKLERIKQWFMRELLSGRIRVRVA